VTTPHDPDELEVLDEEECWALVSSRFLGRLGVNRDGMGPLVVPINYVVDVDRSIVFRTGEGAKLDAVDRGMISIQVDEVDPLHHVGWSVLVDGLAHWVYDPRDDDTPVATWAPGEHPYVVRLHPHMITGRRIRLTGPDTDSRGYR
jgi:nitroimidazol reductase NimA-like FMN-containing flavoprotein (pyridoxamine 5'-phosphate oxidase superfamily)